MTLGDTKLLRDSGEHCAILLDELIALERHAALRFDGCRHINTELGGNFSEERIVVEVMEVIVRECIARRCLKLSRVLNRKLVRQRAVVHLIDQRENAVAAQKMKLRKYWLCCGKAPPVCRSCTLHSFDGSTYDLPGGGYWYVRADLRF